MAVLTVGAGKEFSTVSAAIVASHTGDTIDVQAGTYTNDFPALINGLTIEGVGGIVHFVAASMPPNGAILDVSGNTTIKNVDVSGSGGAGLRYEGGNLVVQNSSFENNANGLVAAADPNGTIWIDHSEFSANGTGTAQTRNIDVGDIARLTVTNSYIHDASAGGEIRSRAEATIVTDDRIYDNGGLATTSIDLPNGGNAFIERTSFEKGRYSIGSNFISYGEEGALHAGTSVTVSDDQFINDRSSAYIYYDKPVIPIHSDNNFVYGVPLASNIEVSTGLPSAGFLAWTYRPQLGTNPQIPATGTFDIAPPAISATESVAGLTTATTVLLSGQVLKAPGGATDVLFVIDTFQGGTHQLGKAAIDANGNWHFAAFRLADGDHAFSILVNDTIGNIVALKAGPDVVIDTTGPALTAAASNQGAPTQATSTILSGTVSDATRAGVSVDILDQENGFTTDLGAAAVASNGTWQFTVDQLSADLNSFTAVATDSLGNSTTSAPVIVQGVTATALTPALQRIVGNVDGGVTLLGTSIANSTVTVTVASAGIIRSLGTMTAAADGTFSLTSHTLLALTADNVFAASATTADGRQGTSKGLFQLSSGGDDTLDGTTGQSDVFATFLRTGHDTIIGFETTAATGATHDVINLSGTGYGSYAQIEPHISGSASAVIQLDATRSVTVSGVSAVSLQASDFRFS